MIEDCVIIGGGVAGLSAANHLVDAGVFPLIIEAGSFPSHKICGEFFSNESLPQLREWQIPMTGQISKARFISGAKSMEFPLPIPAGSCSRYTFDAMLLDRAIKKGAKALTETSVKSFENESGTYVLHLSNGQTISARHLMIGTGRIPQLIQKAPEMKYMGFKAHFENIDIHDCVEMHLFSGGYFGISNVDAKTVNVACLVKKEYVQQPEEFINNLLRQNHRFANARMAFPKWLIGQLPEFGIRTNSDLPNVFWIGDAAGSIPPICGEGLAIAITSGCMAADYFLGEGAIAFKKAWHQRYHRRFLMAKWIHKVMMTPYINSLAVQTCRTFPKLPVFFWGQTRE
jgi:flavin-dependent dehydrogenase